MDASVRSLEQFYGQKRLAFEQLVLSSKCNSTALSNFYIESAQCWYDVNMHGNQRLSHSIHFFCTRIKDLYPSLASSDIEVHLFSNSSSTHGWFRGLEMLNFRDSSGLLLATVSMHVALLLRRSCRRRSRFDSLSTLTALNDYDQ